MDFMKILVIEAFGLNVGYLGCYGNDWVATPNLDRLAFEGVVFDWHIADQPELLPATPWHRRSVGAGRYARPGQSVVAPSLPKGPRVERCDTIMDFADRTISAFEAPGEWLWMEGPSLLPPWDLEDDLLEAYFDEDDIEEGLTPWRDPPFELVTLDDAQMIRLQNTYAAVVTFFDAQLGKLLEHLRGQADVILCVTARSGLPLGEHGMIGTPRPSLHEELVHVPLLMRLPGAEAGMRVSALTQPVDLMPTFLEALGQSFAGQGHTLWPLLRGDVQTVRSFAVSMLRVGEHEAWLMRSPERALHIPVVETGAPAVLPQLFVKPDDRWEVNDLYHQQISAADEMEAELRAFAESITNAER